MDTICIQSLTVVEILDVQVTCDPNFAYVHVSAKIRLYCSSEGWSK